MSETRYCCYFEFAWWREMASSGGGIADFKDGFWITADKKFTKASDRKYWIPPGRILYIVREGKE